MAKLKLKASERIFKMFADKVIKQSIKNLASQDHIDTGKLANKLDYRLRVFDSGALDLQFLMPEYGEFQDKGVKGSVSGRKAYKSPYRFTGSNIKEGVVEDWLKRKGIQGRVKSEWKSANNRGGQFIKRKSLAYIIGRSIALYGLPATRFFSNAFRSNFKQLPKDFIKAYAKDFRDFLKETTREILQ